MKTPPIPSRSVSRALKMLPVLLAGMLSACGPDSDLKPGAPVEREIGGNESHTYRLPFEAGSFISLRIEQPGINVKARLVGPDGKSVPVFDDPGDQEAPDRLAWISRNTGEHQLIVQARDPKVRRGAYVVEVQELRRSRSSDADRLTAAHEYAEGRRLFLTKEKEKRPGCTARFQKALQLWTRSGDQHGQVDAIVQMMEYDNLYGIPENAVKLGEKTVGLARSIGYKAGEARTLQSLANAYGRRSERSQAIKAFQEVLGLWRELRDKERQAAIHYSLANIYYKENQFDQTLEHLQKLQPLVLEADVQIAVNSLVSMGNVQMDMGHTSQALNTCSKALDLAQKSKSASGKGTALHCLGAAHLQRGELEKARGLFEEALKINQSLQLPLNQAYVLQALGSVYFNLGDSERALQDYRRALDISRRLGDTDLEARLLTNTGWIYQSTGDLNRALAYYQQALPIHEKQENKSGIALTLNNMGVAYTVLGKPQEGLSFLLRALELRTSEVKGRAALANTLLEIGSTYRKLGDFRQAEEHFQRSLDLAREVGSPRVEAEGLFRWASLDADDGRLREALDKIQGALTIVESLRSSVFNDKLRMYFFASKRAYYELSVDILMRLEEIHPGRYRGAALEASEGARSRGLLDLLAEGRVDLQQGIAPKLRQKEIELAARLSSLQEKLGKSPSGAAVAELERQLERVQAERVGLESQIRLRHGQYAEIRYPKPLKSEEIQSLIQDGRTALIQYFTGQQSSFLFVVTREGIQSYRLPPRETLSREVTKLREMVQGRLGRRDLQRYRKLASQLSRHVLGPAESVLRHKSRLLIAPDGPLHLLPFEALLLDEEGGRARDYGELPYLLRRYAVSYIPSASVLRDLRVPRQPPAGERSASKQFLGFADPLYGENEPAGGEVLRGGTSTLGGPVLARLVESRKEVENIAALYPRSAVALYVGESATEENFKGNQWLHRARRIHLATHGTVDESQPLRSGLELARLPNSKEDGTLRVDEIFNVRLNADLVTLSACKTALGQEVSGEGVVGMTRAFFYAGAKSLLVSLWPVSDSSTPDLMVDFYRHLGSSQEKTEALRQAKLAMIESKNYAEPYFWAPFILSGNPR